MPSVTTWVASVHAAITWRLEVAGLIYKELWHNKKVRTWTDAQVRLWVMAISYAEDHDSRGFLDEADMNVLLTSQNLEPSVVTELVAGHGLDRVGSRYRIHNYGERGKLSRVRAEAGRKGGGTTQAKGRATSLSFAKANSGVEVGVVSKIFETWEGSLGGRRVSLTPGRRRAIQARLRDGYSELELIEAACGWQNDPWPDRVQQNDLTILFRSGEQVEKFRDLWRNPPPKNSPKNTPSKPAPSAPAEALFAAARRERGELV